MGFFFFFFLREPFLPFFLLLLLPLAADAGAAEARRRDDEDAEADRAAAAAAAGCGDADASRLLLLLCAEDAPERDVPALPSVSDMAVTVRGVGLGVRPARLRLWFGLERHLGMAHREERAQGERVDEQLVRSRVGGTPCIPWVCRG